MYRISILIIVSCLLNFTAKASQTTTLESSQVKMSQPYSFLPENVLPFIGLSLGQTHSDSQNPVQGTPTSLRLLGSYYFKSQKTVFDLGLGFDNQQNYSGNASQGAVSGLMLESALRYRWASNWQAGVVADDYLNQGIEYSASQGDAQFAGLQVLKEFNLNSDWVARAGGRAMTEVNWSTNPVSMLMVEVQLAWGGSKSVQAQDSISAASIPPEKVVSVKNPILAKAGQNTTTPLETQSSSYILKQKMNVKGVDQRLAGFETAQYKLKKVDSAYLNKLAKVLNTHKDLFSGLTVHGYTDRAGSNPYNKGLSAKRAEQVAGILRKSIPSHAKSILAKGEGMSTTASSNPAQDRKVEIELTGVKNHQAVEKVLSSIQ